MPELWAVMHLAPYRDDPATGDDPFAHYLDDMLRERREPFPDPGVVAASGLIDPNYYLINGTDVHEAQLDPAEHFCRYGWREGRKPNIYFDTRWYQQTNPLVDAPEDRSAGALHSRGRDGRPPAGAVFRSALVSRDLCGRRRSRWRWRIS